MATGAFALLLPGIVISLSLFASGGTLHDLPANWALLASPQLLVLVLGACFPRLRMSFLPLALLVLSALFLASAFLASLNPNGAMLWVFYFPACLFSLMALSVVSLYRRRGPTQHS